MLQPVLTIDVRDLKREWHEYVGGEVEWYEAYTQDFTYKKTDIAATPAGAVAASRQVLAGDVHSVCGWCITETTGAAAAQFRLLDGSAVGNEVIGSAKLAQGTTNAVTFSDHGVEVYTGRIFLQVVAGSIEGVIYWR